MKCTIPEISWHNREPVLSVDICRISENFYRLATGGGDSHVVIWQMVISDNGAVKQELLSDLTRHQKAVNCVRWSNNGQYLASGDDDANIIIWQLKTDNIPSLDDNDGDKEIWNVFKVLRGHKEDVYDLTWSVDDTKLFSGSVDNTAILWNIAKGKLEHILTDHKGFVQGVTWDPKNQLIATISTDRICRIFDPTGKHVKARIQKGKLNVPEDHHFHDVEVKFFHDDTFKSFFRRLHFTPDGSLLVVPSGKIENDGSRPLNATLVFTLDNWHSPAVVLPIPRQSSTVVRCCPVLFELLEDGPDPYVSLPYRMIFAVGTDHDIILYDTQQAAPFARFQEIHYTRVTDLTWSHDGLLLVASSTDGFCSLITFEPNELGVCYIEPEADINESILDISGCEELEKDGTINETEQEIVTEKVEVKETEEEKKKRPSFLLQWAQNPSKRLKIDSGQKNQNNVDSDLKQEAQEHINKLTPRRVTAVIVENGSDDLKEEEKKVELKKRPSFLKQWAETTSKSKNIDKASNEADKSKLAVEVKTDEVKDKINVLTPRRITPVKISNPDKKKINVLTPKRIKPVLLDPNSHNSIRSNLEESNLVNSDEKKLTDQEQQEYESASKDIKEFFAKNPDTNVNRTVKHSEAKPIAVRRKPKEQPHDNSKDVPQNNNHFDAKLIAVRRKPKEEKIENTNEDKTLKKEPANEESKQNGDNKKTAKSTPVRRKLEMVSDKQTKRKKSDVETNEASDLICLDDGADNLKPAVKVKVAAMVPKKKEQKLQKVTPPKKNVLLNFLKKPAEKQKKTKKKKAETTKLDISIDLTLDESEAQDAWSQDRNLKEEECLKKVEVGDDDDDVTKDFCLRLEESQDPVDQKEMEEQNKNMTEQSSDVIDKKDTAVNVGTNQNSCKKTSRKVALITVASPKNKVLSKKV